MFNQKKFDDIAKQLKDSLPPSLRDFEQDLQQKFKGILQSSFSHLELVTRDEFDTQCKVLERTREKIEQLESQLAKLTEK